MNWFGVMPAVTTPFDKHLKVDHDLLERHAAWLLSNGCTGLVMLGSLGEGATLEHDEKVAILKTAVTAAGKVPVLLRAHSSAHAHPTIPAPTMRTSQSSLGSGTVIGEDPLGIAAV